jgi:ribosomal peptide maturation radical SAM protein 1
MPQSSQVVFVNMPFAHLDGPALGISMLQSMLAREGCHADIVYLNLIFARIVGKEIYSDLFKYKATNPDPTDHIPFEALAGEWAFSQNYYRDDATAGEGYLEMLKQAPWKLSQRSIDAVLRIKAEVPAFLEECYAAVNWDRYDVVGFTSTFEQTMPSLYLARALKDKYPQLKIIFGGANCEGEMGVELLRQFEFIDCVCLGEGEPVIGKIVDAVTNGRSLKGVANVAYRDVAGVVITGPRGQGTFDLASAPFPNFDDYFEQLELSSLSGEVRPWIHMEASRGCWWGMKQHCTFCGLNGLNMSFRSKPPAQVLNEMMHHSTKHKVADFAFVDNILDMSYFHSLLPALARASRRFHVWFEVKSNLNRDQVKQLSEAGLSELQPGIESFSTKILTQMKKGVTGIQNVAFLKWAAQFGVRAWWNILYGFPNEDEREYLLQLETFKKIVHLQRPTTICQIRLDRFSPNLTQADEMGLLNVRPLQPYGFVFPFSNEVLSRLCYYFDFDYADGRNPHSYTKPLRRFWQEWLQHPSPGELNLSALPDGGALIRDTRFTTRRSRFRLDAVQHFIYQCGDGPTTILKTMRQLRERFPDRSFDETRVRSFFAYMEAASLMLRERNQFLSLAVPVNGDPIGNSRNV